MLKHVLATLSPAGERGRLTVLIFPSGAASA